MENENLIKTVIPFGGEIKGVGFSLSEWQRSYRKNGSYRTQTDDGSVFGSMVNEERRKNGLDPR